MSEIEQVKAYKAGLVQGKAHRALHTHLTTILVPFELSVPEWKLLGLLEEDGSMKLAKIADHLRVEAPLVTALVDGLEKKELVKRTNDILDKRAKVISVTQKGIKLLEDIDPTVKEAMGVLFKGVPHEDSLAYLRVLEAIVKNSH